MDARTMAWMEAFRWFRRGWKPQDAGLSPDAIHPRYYAAMDTLDNEVNRLQEEARKKPK